MQQVEYLKVSSNELTALLKRVFEAIGCDQSAQEDAAHAIVAAQSRGFPALESLPKMLERLQSERPTPAPGLTEHNDWLTIDGNYCSAACYGSVFADLAAAYAKQEDNCAFVSVESCHDRLLILHALQSNAASGTPMLAYWSDHSSDKCCAYLASPDGAADQYIEPLKSEKNSSSGCLKLIAAPDFARLLPHWQRIHAQAAENKVISATEIQRQLELSFADGIRIQSSLWEQLQNIALNVLVPSSERSRAGAGA